MWESTYSHASVSQRINGVRFQTVTRVVNGDRDFLNCGILILLEPERSCNVMWQQKRSIWLESEVEGSVPLLLLSGCYWECVTWPLNLNFQFYKMRIIAPVTPQGYCKNQMHWSVWTCFVKLQWAEVCAVLLGAHTDWHMSKQGAQRG